MDELGDVFLSNATPHEILNMALNDVAQPSITAPFLKPQQPAICVSHNHQYIISCVFDTTFCQLGHQVFIQKPSSPASPANIPRDIRHIINPAQTPHPAYLVKTFSTYDKRGDVWDECA
ncbi:MAG: hypothetical protein LBU31_04255, partial [Coriobacteriales bacterium]|nr:hypothetical protein [Coriobacteriales bacterium]